MARTRNRRRVLGLLRQTKRRPPVVLLVAIAALLVLTACSSVGSEPTEDSEHVSSDSIPDSSVSEASVLLEVISLDHAPIRPAVDDVLSLAGEYGDAVVVKAYSFDSSEGEDFAAENGINEHLPMAIYVNGASEFTIDGRTVLFESFPQGGGTGVVPEGSWTIDDLRAVLDRETG